MMVHESRTTADFWPSTFDFRHFMHICFLDIDGTLLLTGGAGQSAFAETFASDFGTPKLDGKVYFSGRSDKAITMDLFRSHGIEPSQANWERFRAGYLNRLEKSLIACQGAVLPGVPALLHALAARGDVAIGLLTGNMREGARRKLCHYGLWDWFPFGGFGDEHMERCDIAAAALSAAELHLIGDDAGSTSNGTTANRQIVVIGDTPHDVRCGRSIGACCVGVSTGITPAGELQAANPDVLVETLEATAAILELFDH
jgi:phosphoglycolate phosphatase-like HAD superfamily hydrolase